MIERLQVDLFVASESVTEHTMFSLSEANDDPDGSHVNTRFTATMIVYAAELPDMFHLGPTASAQAIFV